jgi:hypothetical protein
MASRRPQVTLRTAWWRCKGYTLRKLETTKTTTPTIQSHRLIEARYKPRGSL